MKNEDSLGCVEHTAGLLNALINVWLLYTSVHCGMFIRNSVHAATLPAYLCFTLRIHRINNPPPSLWDMIVHAITPSINLMACMSFLVSVTDIINQKLGHIYFNTNLIACTVAHEAKIWDLGTYLCKAENQSKWVSQAHHCFHSLLSILRVQTHKTQA